MRGSSSFLFSFAALAAAARFHKRQDPATTFQLYAYGEAEIFIGFPPTLNSTEAAIIIFTQDDSGAWYGSPNTTSTSGSPTWINLALSIPGASASSPGVVLGSASNSTSDRVSDDFGFYGTTAVHFTSSGSMESLWSTNTTVDNGVLELIWEALDTSTQGIPLTLKSTAPSGATQASLGSYPSRKDVYGKIGGAKANVIAILFGPIELACMMACNSAQCIYKQINARVDNKVIQSNFADGIEMADGRTPEPLEKAPCGAYTERLPALKGHANACSRELPYVAND
ncbi:hypothetical protein S7711_10166 [Stachybotrys chartarum IBT 7711]|uniref:Cellobiose dehydrogenase cytochrome domain-containing protein n=1 Tax=Stachybotrys chartarum (strain CBS 109288 / IBT 7711) TaxID=1280523 RepID=A0A084AQI2_STACB|nr:hypothetical protein S7711_10166 [Stachybotrys chartarum IBT 7711]